MPFCKCLTSYHVFCTFLFCTVLVLEISPYPYIQSCYNAWQLRVFLSVDISYCTSPVPQMSPQTAIQSLWLLPVLQ